MVAKSLLILLSIFLSYVCVLGFPKEVQIVGLFDQDEEIQTMFETSVRAVNQDRYNKSKEFSNTYLLADTEDIKMDLYETSFKVCELLDIGIVGVFGPQEKVAADYVQSICNTIEVPYISVRQDLNQSFQARGLNLNLYPHVNSLSRIYNQLVDEFNWKSFAILYENNDSLIRMRLLMKRWDAHDNSAFMYHLGNGPNYRQSMQEIKTSNLENIIIDCSYEILAEVLMQAQQVGILSEKYKVIVTSLDLQTLDLEPYQYSGVNFTGVRLIDPEDPIVLETFDRHMLRWGLNDPSQLRVEPALMYDAVQLFARAFKQLKNATKGDVKTLACDGSNRWEHGLSLSNFMRSTETKGLTGLVKFDTDGFRSNIKLDIVRLTEGGLIKMGQWNSSTGESIKWLPDVTPKKSDIKLSVQNKTFIVLISMTEPYGMQKESATMLIGNERYEGFAIDIIQELSQVLEFNYTFEVDNQYGERNPNTGKWNGMLGKIMDDKADLAITDLTITKARAAYFDFSNPILNLGISILYKKPTKAPPSLFSFLSPFSNDVWIYLIGAFVIVSLLMFIIGRLCPAEWNNPYPCIEEAEVLENQFTFKNAFWFSIGSIMQQGSEIAPIGISTRMIASIWWFFTLIMVSSYTANLAAFLTVETVNKPFDDVEELATKTKIRYGAKEKGATLNFFRDSSHSTYNDMYKYMTTTEGVLVPESRDGINKAINEDYAFLMESVSIEYEIERHCKITQVGGLLDEKGYGIAMKKNSQYLHNINAALLQLSEAGKIQEIKKKWWTQKRGGGKCRENGGPSAAEALDLDNVGGVFVVLAVGVALSCVYTILELLGEVAQKSIQENNGREMLLLYVTVAFMPNILGFPRKIPLGGLFDSDEMIQKAFEISIKAFFQGLIAEYKWKEYAILYDNVDSLIRMNRLLKLPNMNWKTISAMVFHLGSGPNFRQAIKAVKMSECRNIIIDCSYDILVSVLKQAQQIGIMSERYRVIVTSLDLQTLDLEPYQYSGVNLTGIRLIDPESPIVQRTLQAFNWNLTDGSHLRVEAALAYDAVQLFASGYARLRDSISVNLIKLSCNGTEIWGHGFSLSNYMRNEQIHGLSGMIKFDTAGFRSEFQLDIINLGYEGLYKVGRWKPNFGFQWNPGYRIPGIDDDKSLRHEHFIVLISLEADLAITDLTITADRQAAVDFTDPFMNLGISVLYRTPTKAPPDLLSFLGPFSNEVWIYVIGTYVVVSALLFVIGKLCPVEWTNPYPCIKEPEVLGTPYTLIDTPFLVIGAILKAATGFAPAGISTRTLAVAWWFFILIISTTYIANLAAALSTKPVIWVFKTAEELAYQEKIKYGAKMNGSTLAFFRDSTYEPYKIIYKYMEAHANEVLVADNDDGVLKVHNENYAYFMESSSIEYIKQRQCNITQIGGLLDAKGYGIAMRKNASYRKDLSGAILKLQENGRIGELRDKWWKQKRGGDKCDEAMKVTVEPLNLEDVEGVFVIMICGIALSWIFAGWTFLWNIRNIAIRHDVSFKKELTEELRFLIKCSNKKIVKRRKKSVETIKSDSTGY